MSKHSKWNQLLVSPSISFDKKSWKKKFTGLNNNLLMASYDEQWIVFVVWLTDKSCLALFHAASMVWIVQNLSSGLVE